MRASVPCCLRSFNRAPCLPRDDPGTWVAASRSTLATHTRGDQSPRFDAADDVQVLARWESVGRHGPRWWVTGRHRRNGVSIGVADSRSGSESPWLRPGNDLGRGTHSHAVAGWPDYRTCLLRQLTLVRQRSQASPGRPKPSLSNSPGSLRFAPRITQGVAMSAPRSSHAGEPARRSENPHPSESSQVGKVLGRKRLVFHNPSILATTSCGGKWKTTIFRPSFTRSRIHREIRSYRNRRFCPAQHLGVETPSPRVVPPGVVESLSIPRSDDDSPDSGLEMAS